MQQNSRIMQGGHLAKASRVHEDTITVKGWSFRVRTAPIVSSSLLEQYSEQLGGVLTLPEITFGNSILQIRHDAFGVVISFSALEALKQWKKDDLAPLKVNVAKEWQAARMHDIQKQQAVVLEYDWTFTTSYLGSLSRSPPLFGPTRQQQQQMDGLLAAQQQHQHTSPTQHTTSLVQDAAAAADADAGVDNAQHTPNSSSRPLPEWQPSTQQIDRSMLMSKDEPILFYAEVPLYESELDDNGVCQLTVKVSAASSR